MRNMFHFYYSLVFTKSVTSTLAPQLGRSLAIHCFATGAKMASRFEACSEDEIRPINEAVFTNKYQESDFLWLVGVYW